jgi:membrane-bound serine protease (ClpP class)
MGSFLVPGASSHAEEEGLVYVVQVHDVVEKGLLAYMKRAFAEADEAGADHIILDIHTPGGAVDAASEIGNLIQNSPIPVTAFVNTEATSAGAFIALNADTIVMAPTGTMGSAQVVDLEGNAADEKAQSNWRSRMASAAEDAGRDPIYAEAMVDPSIEIEGLVSEGQLLNFRASEAIKYGYAEAIAKDLDEVLQFLNLPQAEVVHVEISWAEHLARFITHPIVASILLTLGSLGLIIELYTPGFGVPGILGISGLVLYFFGHTVAGLAGWEAIVLFVAGIILLLIEFFVPGFGIFGILGIAGVLGSMVLASGEVWLGVMYVVVALIIGVIALIILSRFLGKRGMWSRLVLEEGLSTEETQALRSERSALVGKTGVALTPLRLAGTVRIGEERYDVVSDGQWIEQGSRIKVVHVDGPRIVVRKVEDHNP